MQMNIERSTSEQDLRKQIQGMHRARLEFAPDTITVPINAIHKPILVYRGKSESWPDQEQLTELETDISAILVWMGGRKRYNEGLFDIIASPLDPEHIEKPRLFISYADGQTMTRFGIRHDNFFGLSYQFLSSVDSSRLRHESSIKDVTEMNSLEWGVIKELLRDVREDIQMV